MILNEKVTVVKVPMDINTFVQDRTSKIACSASVKEFTQIFARMPDKYIVNVCSWSEETKYVYCVICAKFWQGPALEENILELPETAKIHELFY